MAVALNDLPERSVSTHPNFVTPEGLRRIELALAVAQHGLAEARGDPAARAALQNEIEYWTTRRATAQVVPHSADRTQVRFGSAVVLEAGGGRETLTIVGEDEADPAAGTLSYVSPLAQALLRRRPGETVEAEGRTYRIVEIA